MQVRWASCTVQTHSSKLGMAACGSAICCRGGGPAPKRHTDHSPGRCKALQHIMGVASAFLATLELLNK